MDGLTILHITDTHVTRPQAGRRTFQRILRALQETPVDLIALTGDYMSRPGNEPEALRALDAMAAARDRHPPRLGVYGVFGNHDTPFFIEKAKERTGIRWLENALTTVPGTADLLQIVGVSYPEDLLAVLLDAPVPPTHAPSPFRLVLAHHPTELLAAAEMGLPLVLAGHTHGGQIRVHAGLAPHTSSDLPPDMAAGVLRLRQSLLCISRGLGETIVEVRFNCPPQMPLYTLRRGPLPRPPSGRPASADHWSVVRILGW